MNNLEKTENEWKNYLQEGYTNTVESYMNLGKRLNGFKESCEKVSGGSEFSVRVKDWIGLSSNRCYELIKISTNSKLILNKDKLPNSKGSLYALTNLTEEDF